MARKSSHTEKTQPERTTYARYIKERDYTPTVDRPVGLRATNEPGEDHSEPTTNRRREIPFSTKLAEHLKSKWIEWLVGLAIVAGGYLIIDSKINFAALQTGFEDLKGDVSDLKQTSKDHDKQLQQHEVELQEDKIRLENLEKPTSPPEPKKGQ